MRRFRLLAFAVCICITPAGCKRKRQAVAEFGVALDQAIESGGEEGKLVSVVGKLPRDGKYLVFDGDIRLTKERLRSDLHERQEKRRRQRNKTLNRLDELEVHDYIIVDIDPVSRQPDYWQTQGSRHLTYAIDAGSFGTQYSFVMTNFESACQTWMDACRECGVVFEHKRELDSQPGISPGSSLTFVVRLHSSNGLYYALAFFPSDATADRYVDVDPRYFGALPFDPVGVFRHEVGHILGYRHEQDRGVAGCVWTDNNWKELTPPDARSVMISPCGGAMNQQLDLSDSDIEGHRRLYLGSVDWRSTRTPADMVH